MCNDLASGESIDQNIKQVAKMSLVKEGEEELPGIFQTKNPQESENYNGDNHEDEKSQYNTKHDSLRRVSAAAGDILPYVASDERQQSRIPEGPIEDDFLLRQCRDFENKNELDSLIFYHQSPELSDLHEMLEEPDNETSISTQQAEDNGNMFYVNEYIYNSDGAIFRNLVTDIEYDDDHRRDMQLQVPKRNQRSTVRRGSIERNDKVGIESGLY